MDYFKEGDIEVKIQSQIKRKWLMAEGGRLRVSKTSVFGHLPFACFDHRSLAKGGVPISPAEE